MGKMICQYCGSQLCAACGGCTKEACPSLAGYLPCKCSEKAYPVPVCPECRNCVCPDCGLCYEPDCDQQACQCITDRAASARFIHPNVFTLDHEALLRWMQTPPHDLCGIEEERLKSHRFTAPELYQAIVNVDLFLWWLTHSGLLTPREIVQGIAACADTVGTDLPMTQAVYLHQATTRIRQWLRGEVSIDDLGCAHREQESHAAYHITRAAIATITENDTSTNALRVMKAILILVHDANAPAEAHRRMCATLRTMYPLSELQERISRVPARYHPAESAGRQNGGIEKNPYWDVSLTEEDERYLDRAWEKSSRDGLESV